MTDLFRLKKEALPFFEYKFKNISKPADWWRDKSISNTALELAPKAYIRQGISIGNDESYKKMSSHTSNTELTEVHFTLCIDSTSNRDYNEFIKEGNVRELIEALEETANDFIKKSKI